MQTWISWQGEIVALLRGDFEEMLHRASMEGEGWTSWRSFYLEGMPTVAAVSCVPERDSYMAMPHRV